MQIKKYKKKFSIAVDGQSATGKSTGSKFISKYFDFDYLSSGKLYRYCAYILLKKKLNCNPINIKRISKTITLEKLKGVKLYNKKVNKIHFINYDRWNFCIADFKRNSSRFCHSKY